MALKREDQAVIDKHKLLIETEWRRFNKHKEGAHVSARSAKAAILAVQREYDAIEAVYMRAMLALNEEQQHQQMDLWITYSDTQQEKLAQAWTTHNAMEGAEVEADPSNSITAAASARLDSVRDILVEEIASLAQRLQADTAAGEDGEEKTLSKLQARLYNKQISELKLRIWPGMDEALENLCQKDLNNAAQYHAAHPANMKAVSEPFIKLAADYASKKFAEDCDDLNNSSVSAGAASLSTSAFGVPAASSTVINSSSFRHRPRYKEEEKIPSFTGDPADYGLWKQEWQNSIIPFKEEAWILRNMAEKVNCPDYPDLKTRIKQAKVSSKAFSILDQLFANPTVVAQRVCRQFEKIKVSDLDNFTPQAQLVSLDTKVRTLLNSLESVGEDGLLKAHSSLLFHAIDLLPRQLKTEFNNERQVQERAARNAKRKFTGGELLELLLDFMDNKCTQYREYEPDTLIRKARESRTSPEDDHVPSRGKGKNGKKSNTQLNSRQSGDGNPSSPLEGLPADRQEAIKSIWAKNGPCPICKAPGHVWKGDKGTMASDQVGDCAEFRRLKVDDRVKEFKKHKLCRRCLSWSHQVDNCTLDTAKVFCKKKDDNGDLMCKQDHATLLCGSGISLNHITIPKKSFKSSGKPALKTDVMLAIILFPINNATRVVTLLDNGSNSSLITHRLAKKLGLKGYWVNQVVELAGQKPSVQRVAYYRLVIRHSEETFEITVVGLDRISTSPGSYSVSKAYEIFPHIERGVLDKPEGDIELLIGADQVRFMPGGGDGVNLVDNLRVFDIKVAPFKVLMGSHPDITFINPILSDTTINYRQALFSTVEPLPVCVNYWDRSEERRKRFAEANDLSNTINHPQYGEMVIDTFLIQLAHFMSIRGPTSYIYSDMGSNLTAASERFRDYEVGERSDLNWRKVREKLDELTLLVQRISVLLAAEERHKLPPATEDLHICEADTRVSSVSLESGQVETKPAEDTIVSAQDIPVGEAARTAANLFALKDHTITCSVCVIRSTVQAGGERESSPDGTPSSPPQ